MYRIRLGRREAPVQFRSGLWTTGPQAAVPDGMADTLGLRQPLDLTAYVSEPGVVEFGPLVGVLLSESKLAALVAGKADWVSCRYARAASEAGAGLLFLSTAGLGAEDGMARGYLHRCHPAAPCVWEPAWLPAPSVIYDRCFGEAARQEATRVRSVAPDLGIRVVNTVGRISRLEAFVALQAADDLKPALPATEKLTPRSLARALKQHDDVYLKPEFRDAKLQVYRLTRREGGWQVVTRADHDSVEWLLPAKPDLKVLVRQVERAGSPYLLQEGLPLAACLGNRFVLRALVQRDGLGRWAVSGLAARLAPRGAAFTAARGARWVVSPETALSHAFPDRWQEVLSGAEQTALRLADAVDRHLGHCLELGLDLGVLQDGSIKLIDLSGKPLRPDLEQFGDPLACQRMDRYPIHCAAYWAVKGVGTCSE